MYSSTLSLTSALDGVGGQRHGSADLTPGRAVAHCTVRWVGPRTGLDEFGKSRPHRNPIPGLFSP